MGIGLSIGPVIGAVISNFFTFPTTMFIFAVIVLVIGLYGVSLLPNELDRGKALLEERS